MIRIILLLLCICYSTGNPSCPQLEDGMINVHLVCHTHDDTGWLKTVDQYYYGAYKEITYVGVQYILDSVMDSLKKDTNRKFIWVESAFFFRWWDQQDDEMKQLVQDFIQSGQLEFIGGGWSMNDEACPMYSDIIDQLTLGISMLSDTFGPESVPRIAWQIDPFGHTSAQANIFADMGFDGYLLNRIDYGDFANRVTNEQMEMIWNPAYIDIEQTSEIFTGILPNHYSPPDGFCFDLLCNDDPIMDDSRLEDYNVDEKVDLFLQRVQEHMEGYTTNNVIMTMGNDFNYVNAEVWYKNLDKLIMYVNDRQMNGSNVNVVYSTPSCYVDSVNAANQTWTVKTDDFMPYATEDHSFWTGYYTSRPTHKRYIRDAYPFLQAGRQMSVMLDEEDQSIDKLSRVMGLLQHHDAITGTSKTHVDADYNMRLSESIESVQNFLSYAFGNLTGNPGMQYEFCEKVNISECAFTESRSEFVVTLYNPSGDNTDTFVQIPISSCDTAYEVLDSEGTPMPSQIVPISERVKSIPGRNSVAECDLYFQSEEIPPLSAVEYYVAATGDQNIAEQMAKKYSRNYNERTIVENEEIQLIIDESNKVIYKSKSADVEVEFTSNYFMYYGMEGDNSIPDKRASGAYIFRPNGSDIIDGFNETERYVGNLFEEIRYESDSNPWVSYVWRIFANKPYTEIEWIVGPIPIDDGVGKEIVHRISFQDVNSGEDFYTDSNGRGFLRRRRNYRPTWDLKSTEPESQNYYPINTGIILKDLSSSNAYGIIPDRSEGGSSIQSGEMELMLHRRLLFDDNLGVEEPLNETAFGEGLVVKGKQYLLANFLYPNGTFNSSSVFNDVVRQVRLPPIVAFSESTQEFYERKKPFNNFFKPTELPEDIHLLSLQPWYNGKILLRLERDGPDPLENSFSNSNEDSIVNIKALFMGWDIRDIEEVTLAAAHIKKNKQPMSWNGASQKHLETDSFEEESGIYHFKPQQIRTFLLEKY